MFKVSDVVTFDRFGEPQRGEIISSRKVFRGIAMYKIKILSPAKKIGWQTMLAENDLTLCDSDKK